MPYDIQKQGDKYAIIKQDTGEVVGHSDTRALAEASVRARYAGEGPKKKSPGMLAGGVAGGPLMAVDDTYTPRPIDRVYVGGKAFKPAPPKKPEVEEEDTLAAELTKLVSK